MADPADDPARLVACLKSLGLTKYEALVYIALLKVTGATATEIHGICGVPRASVYPVLDQLREKELVAISQSSPKRFAALPPDEGIGNLLSRIEQDAARAQDALTAIYQQRMSTERGDQGLIWNVYGITAIRKRLAELLSHAQHRIRIMAHPQLFSDEVKTVLRDKAYNTTTEIVTHDWRGECPSEMQVYMMKKPPHIQKDRDRAKDLIAGGICIIDDWKVMVVVGSGDEDAVALYSESVGFVRFFIRYYNLITEWAKKTDE